MIIPFSNMVAQMGSFSTIDGKFASGPLKLRLATDPAKLDPYPEIRMFALKKAILWTRKIADGFSLVWTIMETVL